MQGGRTARAKAAPRASLRRLRRQHTVYLPARDLKGQKTETCRSQSCRSQWEESQWGRLRKADLRKLLGRDRLSVPRGQPDGCVQMVSEELNCPFSDQRSWEQPLKYHPGRGPGALLHPQATVVFSRERGSSALLVGADGAERQKRELETKSRDDQSSRVN